MWSLGLILLVQEHQFMKFLQGYLDKMKRATLLQMRRIPYYLKHLFHLLISSTYLDFVD